MNPTITWITARALLGRRRFFLLLPLPVLVVGLAVLSDRLGAEPDDWAPPVIIGLGLSVVLPVMALVISTGVLGSEIDDGTLVHILAKPIPRSVIVMSKLVVAFVATTITVGAALFATALIAGSAKLGLGLLAGAAVGSLAYGALFLALSVLTRRPVLVGLGYLLIWESLLSNLLTGTRVLSIQQYVISVADRISGWDQLTAEVSLPVALVMAGVFVVAASLVSIDRLRSFTLVGETS